MPVFVRGLAEDVVGEVGGVPDDDVSADDRVAVYEAVDVRPGLFAIGGESLAVVELARAAPQRPEVTDAERVGLTVLVARG